MFTYGVNFLSSNVLPNPIGTKIMTFLLQSLAPKVPPAEGDKTEKRKR